MVSTVPASLASRNPLAWLRVFGPGAIIASLTIGTGELIFSSRGGAVFGYPILLPFMVICLLKWTLAYSTARHMVLSGAHPYERWMDLPVGPRGWLPVLFVVLGMIFIPVWVSFHASVLGDLIAGLTGTKGYLGGATVHLWGIALLLAMFALAYAGGYGALEKTQLAIVASMLGIVVVALIMLGPDWLELARGFFVPQTLAFPDWLKGNSNPVAQQIAARPIWVELTLYVGVIGGAGYDYLAYASFLREKGWGLAAEGIEGGVSEKRGVDGAGLNTDSAELRRWIRAPLVDCTLSFVIVLVFSAVFVAAGKLVLGPARQLPGDGAFLEHQANFVTQLHPWLYPVYVSGAFLAMLGTLYGTLEVTPTVLREGARSLGIRGASAPSEQRLRMIGIGWCTAAALAILLVSFALQLRLGISKPPGLTAILIPVNFFTGVFACGLISLLNPWMDRRLAPTLRMPPALAALNLVGGIVFLIVGIRGYWDYGGWTAIGILLAMLVGGAAIAPLVQGWVTRETGEDHRAG